MRIDDVNKLTPVWARTNRDAEDETLYRVALEVEGDARLAAEMADWEIFVADGLTPDAATTAR